MGGGEMFSRTKTPEPTFFKSLVISGGKGESRGIGKGEITVKQNFVENMYPLLCIRSLDKSHGFFAKNYGRG